MCEFYCSTLAVVVVMSFVTYLMSFFLLERFGLNYAGGVTVSVFAFTWSCLIVMTTREMQTIRSKIGVKAAATPQSSNLKSRLLRYCQVNVFFGSMLCVFHVLRYMINSWFTDDISASLVNIGFDTACLGVASG